MYFISFLTDVLTMKNFLYYPQVFVKNVKFWKGFPSNFGGNLSYCTLCLRENLTMTNFLHYPLYKIAVLKNRAIFTAKFMWTAVSGITENIPYLASCKFIDVLEDWL